MAAVARLDIPVLLDKAADMAADTERSREIRSHNLESRRPIDDADEASAAAAIRGRAIRDSIAGAVRAPSVARHL